MPNRLYTVACPGCPPKRRPRRPSLKRRSGLTPVRRLKPDASAPIKVAKAVTKQAAIAAQRKHTFNPAALRRATNKVSSEVARKVASGQASTTSLVAAKGKIASSIVEEAVAAQEGLTALTGKDSGVAPVAAGTEEVATPPALQKSEVGKAVADAAAATDAVAAAAAEQVKIPKGMVWGALVVGGVLLVRTLWK